MTLIYVRKADETDQSVIMQIIDNAKAFLKSYGSPQWQDGHPNAQMINDDIVNERGYVLVVDNEIAGYAAVSFEPESNYKQITDGQWKRQTEPYAVIHRLAISNEYRGQRLSKIMLSNLISIIVNHQFVNVRIDTHPLNKPLQGLVASFGFVRRGQINVIDKLDPIREAFELNL
ncbi:GNAT family N-acetyltransferase [Lentilactobacillus kosonis]|uniref:Histone acetyltransferase HPA2 and related acetyltransferases n=1 Tax=Lentilactobacillus kosonis TaxID=2810561 RepID=A0A401FM77_9LACO|nr:GNAT family N-acetyltransferase [Lentilactobacillus kosonis]GAY73453.1 histone acetyltransferase HPA2 and related acetyltransferases [Lentilactobacillus kosonis]